VSAAERGEREWVAADLVRAAYALKVSIQDLFRVPEGASPSDVVDDTDIPIAWISGEGTASPTPDDILADIDRSVQALKRYTLTGSEVTVRVTEGEGEKS
jgi:hypothetical protein